MTQTVKSSLLHSLSLRMILLIGLSIGSMTIGFGAVLLWSSARTMEGLIQAQARAVAQIVAKEGVGALAFRDTRRVQTLLQTVFDASEGSLIWAVALDAEGRPIAGVNDRAADPALLASLVQQAISTGTSTLAEDGLHFGLPVFRDDDNRLAGVFALGWSNKAAGAASGPSNLVLLLSTLGLAVAATTVTTLLLRRTFLRPLRQLTSSGDPAAVERLALRPDLHGQLARATAELRQKAKTAAATERTPVPEATVFASMPHPLMLIDEHLRLTAANPALSAFIATLLPDLDTRTGIGQPIEALLPSGTALREAVLHALRSGQPTNLSIGSRRLLLSPSPLPTGQPGQLLEWQDVTELHALRAVSEGVDGTMLKAEFDAAGILQSANSDFNALLGATSIGGAAWSLHNLAAGGAGGQFMQQAARGRAQATLSVSGSRGPVTLACSLSSLRDLAGQPSRYLLLARNVSEEQQVLDQLQSERQELQAQQAAVVTALRHGMRQLSNGDLTTHIDQPFDSQHDELRQEFNRAVDTLASVMRDVIGNAQSIRNEARDISSTAHTLAQRTESSAATLEQTAAALDGLTVSVRSAADGAAEADRVVAEAKTNAEQSGNIVVETVSAMDTIAASSEKITSIVKVIDDIAFQTNLLALNAGVEAARAGDAGRGFAVVASEVRALAQRSSEAAREINDLILKSGGQVKRGVDLVGKTGEALKQIVASVSDISVLVSEIAVSSKQQSLGLAEINSAVNDLDQSTQQNAARLEEATAASESLTNDAIALVESVAHFRLDGQGGSAETVVSFRARNPQARAAAPAPRVAATGTDTPRSAPSSASDAGWEDF